MKIYRKALSKKIKDQVEQHHSGYTLNGVFGEATRIVIPIVSEKLQFIFNSLEQGETASGKKYQIDQEKKIAYQFKLVGEEWVFDPRPFRLGKVIQKELGDEWVDAWSIEANSVNSDDKSIILSRSPVDIVRMSDHKWRSCHSPGGSYFGDAIEEATAGGAIAYVVQNEDLQNFIKSHPNGEEALQEEEIFNDRARDIQGIKPLARTRINRYVDKNDEDIEIAMPITNVYGDDVSGFLDTITKWLLDKQKEFISYDELDLSDFQRTGGAYADESDSDIIKNFFGHNMGIKRDLDHKGGGNRADIWQEELEEIMAKINPELKHSSVFANADESDGMAYISAYGSVSFSFRGYISSEMNYQMLREINKIENLRMGEYCGHIENAEYENANGMATLRLDTTMDYDEGIDNPDTFNHIASYFKMYEDDFYDSDAKILQSYLMEVGILVNNDAVTSLSDYMKGRTDDTPINEDEDSLSFVFYTKAKSPWKETETREEIEGKKVNVIEEDLRKYISESFREAVKRHLDVSLEFEDRQLTMPFYDQEIEQTTEEHNIDYSELEPGFSVVFEDEYDLVILIKIPSSEMYKLGKRYLEHLMFSYNAIRQEVESAIAQYLSRINQSVVGNNWYLMCKLSAIV